MTATKLFLLLLIMGVGADADALTGLPACTSTGQANCVSAVSGGETAIIPYNTVGGPGVLVYGDLNSGQTVYLTAYTGASAATSLTVQGFVAQATANIAEFAPYAPLPTCPNTYSTSYCYAVNPGGNTVLSSSNSSTYVYITTPVNQTANRYQTTIDATLNGNQIYQQSFALSSSDPAVQSAIEHADTILASDGATFAGPVLASESTTLLSSQTSDVQTGPPVADGNVSFSTISTFGPAVILVGPDQTEPFYVNAGQLDVNVNRVVEYNVPQNAVTTNTYLTTRMYDIAGTFAATPVPEPGTWILLLCGFGVVIYFANRNPPPFSRAPHSPEPPSRQTP